MIEINGVSRIYGEVAAVDDVSMTVGKGDIAVIVGTSGSGKTTLMRMINRLVEPSAGRILIDGEDNRTMPAHELRRGIGYAMQGHGLFPHRTVAENIATVPLLLGWQPQRIAARVDELLTLFHLDPALFRTRMPWQLSGGQQQRVGVARALAAEPPVLLMDEPFGALDPIIREKAQDDLLTIQRAYGTTIMLVTHDMDEALRLGTRIGVMDRGRLVQYDTPLAIVSAPATDFVRSLLGAEDRAFRMLSLSRVGEIVEAGEAPGVAIPADMSLRAALAESLWSRRTALPVERDGQVIGQVTRAALEDRGAIPQ